MRAKEKDKSLIKKNSTKELAKTISSENKKTNNNKDVDKFKVFELYFIKNVPQAEIARLQNCSRVYIHQLLQPFKEMLKNHDALEIYEKNKTKLLTAAEMKILENMLNDKVIKKASGNNLAYMFQQVFNANRLEKGQSTANISIRTQSASDYANDSEQLQANASNDIEKDNNINAMQADAISGDSDDYDSNYTESSDI